MKTPRKHLLFIVLALVAAAGPAQALQVAHLWHNQAGDASSQFGYDVAIDDATGRVAMTGYFGGSINFGGTTLTSAGSNDGFVVVFAPDGELLAQRQFGGTGNQIGIALDWSNDGHLFVTGHFAGSANFGGSTLTSAGLNDIFVVRYDYLLTHSSSSRFGDASEQIVSDIAVDASGNVVMTGYFQGTVSFGGIVPLPLTSAGANDIYVVKFDSNLLHAWSDNFGDAAASQYGQGVDTDGAGNVYLCGYFAGTVNFGGSSLTSAGSNDIYVAKLNAAGTHQWSKKFGDAVAQVGSKISASSSGEVYVVGYFSGVVNFGGGALTSAGSDDIFLAKFSTTGSFQWASRFGDAGAQFGLGVDNDDTHVYMSGQSSGAINFGTGGIHNGAGGRDIYIAKFTAAGVHVLSRIYGDSADQFGFGVDVAGGRVAVVGYFQGAMSIGSTPVTSAGGSDAILMVMSISAAEPVIKSITDVGNDQGRKVRVRIERSGFDDAVAIDPIIAYEAWVEEPFAEPGASSGANASPQGGGGDFVYVGSIPAHTAPVYTMIVPTFVDSTIAEGDYNSRVLIRAARGTPTSLFQSTVGTGSSIDNLAPGMENLRFDLGLLHWNGSDAPDVDYYTIYGGSTANFGSATLIDYTIDTQIDMDANPRAYYFVTATDFSGNEGEPKVLRVLTGAGGESPSSHVLSISAYPNPFNPATTIRYTVPARDRVRVEIFDARGTLVRRLVDGDRPTGAYTVTWDGSDSSGVRAGSGIYFARITQRDGARSYKLVLLK